MKLLLDSCVAGSALDVLLKDGHDVVWAGHWQPDPGDEQIIRRAGDEDRVLVTIDKDFGELAEVRGLLRVGMIRLIDFRAMQQGPAILRLLQTYHSEIHAGCVITAEPWRVRIRPTRTP